YSDKIGPEGAESGQQTADEAGDDADGEGETEDPEVEAGALNDCQVWRNESHESLESEDGKNDAEQSAGERQEKALGEQLANELPWAGAKRRAQTDFAFAGSVADQEEVNDIGAGDEQHEADSTEENEKSSAKGNGGRILKLLDNNAEASVRVGIENAFLFVQALDIVASLIEADAGFAASDSGKGVVNVLGEIVGE